MLRNLKEHEPGNSRSEQECGHAHDEAPAPLAVRSYAYRNHLDLPFYVAEDADVPEAMHLNQYPSTFIYARDGSIAAQHAGAGDWSDESVIQFIEQLRAQ